MDVPFTIGKLISFLTNLDRNSMYWILNVFLDVGLKTSLNQFSKAENRCYCPNIYTVVKEKKWRRPTERCLAWNQHQEILGKVKFASFELLVLMPNPSKIWNFKLLYQADLLSSKSVDQQAAIQLPYVCHHNPLLIINRGF